MLELIKKKRDGLALSAKEFNAVINGLVAGEIPDYQLAAFLMAVYFKGMNKQETANLTHAMMYSGECMDLSEIKGIKVDKHSTGGVGDKTTLVLAPLVAAAGVPVAKMSGRGLSFTGGTFDKLKSIKGLSMNIPRQQFIQQIKQLGIALCGQSENLVPADKKLYALRDVTGTVDSLPLIASSIMSKKLACGADAMVIDIKVGEGTFMKDKKRAIALANMMMDIGASMNKKVVPILTAMQEPLGYAVGNALEVQEAIATLKGEGPEDLTHLCLELGGEMLVLGKKTTDRKAGRKILEVLLQSGAAFKKFKALIQAQGGDIRQIEQPDLLPSSPFSETYNSKEEGYITELNALEIGVAAMNLGAGRATKESEIDYGAGILLKKKVGDYVKKGEALAILYSNKKDSLGLAKKSLEMAYRIGETAGEKRQLILDVGIT